MQSSSRGFYRGVLIFAVFGCALAGVHPLSAATITILNTADNGAGSLRQAISDNNATSGGNTIVFDPGVTGTITLLSGQLAVLKDVTIVGPGPGVLAVSGNTATRVLLVSNAVVRISGLSMVNGKAQFDGGGGVMNWGTLTLSNCVVADCVGGNGGGVFNEGSLTVVDSTIRHNSASISAGGIANFGGLLLIGSSIISNAYTGFDQFNAGGIYGGQVISNCTVTANTGGNAAILGYSGLVLLNSTVADNGSEGVSGGGDVGNCIIAGNTGTSDVFGDFTSLGYNLIGRTNFGAGWGSLGDQVGSPASPINPQLLPLGYYGGPTPTMPPAPGSPAIDQGKSFGAATDQRGRPRTYDNPAVANAFGGDGTDIGAVEFGPATAVVTTTNDAGPGSLRQAILDASATEDDTIGFAANVTNVITLTSGELPISKDLNIVGPGPSRLAVSGNDLSSVFEILDGHVAISGLTIRNGRLVGSVGPSEQNGPDERGAGLMNQASLALTNCAIINNAVFGGTGGDGGLSGFAGNGGNARGGGLANIGTLTAVDCTFANNTATGGSGGSGANGNGMGGQGYGGGLYSFGSATLTRCTVSANNAIAGTGPGGVGSGAGGGLYNEQTLTILASTIANNSATGSPFDFGGGIYDNGTLTVRSSTIAGNQADYGGGLYTGGADLGNTILAGNSAPGTGPDCGGPFVSSDFNLVQNTNGYTVSGTTTHNIIGQDPLLGPLADNGGPTLTMALPAGSPALDKGASFGLTSDQRGQPRPTDIANISNVADGSDIGAFERLVGLWSDAADLGGGWKWLEWFGYFNTNADPWIYHLQHAWLYPVGTDTSSVFFWDNAMANWWWTSATTYPYVYRFSDSSWLWYQKDSAGPRWFYNLTTAKWESW